MGEEQVHRIEDLSVAFISLVEAPANQRSLLVKSAAQGQTVFERQVVITKQDAARRMAYGLVLVPDEVDDWKDTISKEEIEKAAYAFMRSGATTQIDADHDREAAKGFVAESWIVREGDSLFPEEPPGAWAVGVKVIDDEVWSRVESGELTGFSVMGLARREPVEENAADEDVLMGKSSGGLAAQFIRAVKKGLFGGDGASAAPSAPASSVVEKMDDDTAAGSEPVSKSDDEEDTMEKQGFAGFVEPLVKQLPETIKKEPSTFRTELGKELLYNGTYALRSAISEAIDSDEVDTMEGVQAAIDDFGAWLLSLLGFDDAGDAPDTSGQAMVTASEPGADEAEPDSEVAEPASEEAVSKSEEPEEDPDPSGQDMAAVVAAAVEKALGPVSARIETLEKATPGRRTLLGEDAPVKKEKGFKGLPLRI